MTAPDPGPGRGDREDVKVRQGLEAWARFPADRRPRPLILLSAAVQPTSFPDGQTKLAFEHGSIEAGAGFPAPVLRALRGQPRPWEGPGLLVTSATLSETEFVTDRGRQRLPAWCVYAQDVPDPIWVLDPATATWQPPGWEGSGWLSGRATLGTDGRTLTMSFSGSPKAYTSYPGARILESGHAVALIPIRTELVTGWRQPVARTRQVTATLDRPLGNRILLDGEGSPVMVTTGAA